MDDVLHYVKMRLEQKQSGVGFSGQGKNLEPAYSPIPKRLRSEMLRRNEPLWVAPRYRPTRCRDGAG